MRIRSKLLLPLFALAACSSEPVSPTPVEDTAVSDNASAPGALENEPDSREDAEAKNAPEQPVELVATLAAIDGKALVNEKPASVGRALSAGDVIVTRRRGHADIHLTDGSRIRLGPGSRLRVGELSREAGMSVSLLLGKLYSAITPGTPYEVVTRNAVAGVRGTKFFVEEKKRRSYVCVCEGTVGVKGPRDEEEVALEKGFDLYATEKKAGKPKESGAQMLDDLNAVFDALAAAGETPATEEAEGADGE